jgi:hypothetical protein
MAASASVDMSRSGSRYSVQAAWACGGAEQSKAWVRRAQRGRVSSLLTKDSVGRLRISWASLRMRPGRHTLAASLRRHLVDPSLPRPS